MRLLLFALLAFFAVGNINAQNEDGLFKDFGDQKLERLEQRMADQIEFCILDDQSRLSKGEAIGRLKRFLSKNKVRKSRQVHYGDSKENGSFYRVGKLNTDNGVYRLFLYFENDKIVELRVDSY